ncbi:hypothetical protein SERLA73DRAFT_163637 [Serpula lacrymans var. lacrymans S7.3]|uniref:Rab-GAP TBC domain-containing protein n=1 Tax=Serpula lacrymans var. lacrymans (strain S7.3) TaxID=936435 RepID=F8QEV2_SERL3|nr:hypothetical protein SERLA73DRAFT_163637 [Serpula lacrymans var. lacrymans S7.3]
MASDAAETVSRQVGKGLEPRFNFDDAFADEDGEDEIFEFSSAAIRKQLAENYTVSDDTPTESGSVILGQDTSVSTFDLDGSIADSRSRSLSPSESPQPRTPEELDAEDGFSQVSLSEGHAELEATEEKQITSNGDAISTDKEGAYPAVHIDVSKSPSSRVETATDIETNTRYTETYSSNDKLPSSSSINPVSHSFVNEVHSSNLPSSLSLPLSIGSASSSFKHKPARSTGPSVLQQVVSKTRPPFLPPKSREEDKRHMADWETMMKHSRAAEEKRRKALQERRFARESKIELSIPIWEKEILPDWRVVSKKSTLKNLWWSGIPTKLRASMWERAVGNPLALSKDNYRTCFARAKRALASGVFPSETIHLIEEDILSTLPALHIFHPETGPLYQDLKDMLCAWVVSRSDEGLGYVTGISKIAAMFLINMPPHQGFIVMRNLLERHCMRSFYGGAAAKEEVEAYYRIFDTLLADGMPKIYFNFKQHQISPSAYLPDWLIPLFLNHLPFEACARVWDVLLLEGDSFLFRAALAILAVLEPRLFFPDRRELLELLRGENKAALDVAKRDARPLDGGKYEIYGVDEETLWERIESMEEWWRESTWKRLIQRELPDL